MSAFATPTFLEFANPDADKAIVDLPGGRKIPLLLVVRESTIFGEPRRFGVTPICLCGPRTFRLADLNAIAAAESHLAGGFVQSRDPSREESGFYVGQRVCAFLDSRTNYRLPLGLDDGQLLSRMKRDSYGRTRRLLREADRYKVVEATGDRSAISCFAAMYEETAIRVGFADAYHFTEARFQGLLAAPPWRLFLLEHAGTRVSGAAVAEVEGGFDYTFMAYERYRPDASRANILFLYRHLSESHTGAFDLGGGISEDDALARFKLGMGAAPTRFRRARFAFVDTRDTCLVDRCRAVLTARFP